jgi:hypothetical protein
MFLYFSNWDIRGLFHYLEPLSRLYVLFLMFVAVWTISLPLRITFWTRPTRDEESQTALAPTKLAAWHRNLTELFVLNLILFGGCFCNELLRGIRSEQFIRCNPNIDAIGPFDALLSISLLGFAGLILVHCIRWWVLIKSNTNTHRC